MMVLMTMMIFLMMNFLVNLTPLLPKVCQAAIITHGINTKQCAHEAAGTAKGWLRLLLSQHFHEAAKGLKYLCN